MTRPRVAVIGLGGISQSVHLPLLRRRSDLLELVAVVDASPSRAARAAAEHGVVGLDSIDALLAAVARGDLALDGAVLATTGSHAPDVARLVGAGIRVLAEKPIGLSLAEVDELTALTSERGIDLREWVRVGTMKEYDPATRHAARLLEPVTLRAVSVEVLHPADAAQLAFANLPPAPTDVPPERQARFRAATAAAVARAIGDQPEPLPTLYANVVLGSIVHDIAVLRALTGGIGTVERARHTGPGLPGSLSLGGELATTGTPWSIDWHFIPDYPEYRERLTFHHERGTISLTFPVPYLLNAPTVVTVVSGAEPLGSTRSETRWPQQEAFENELLAFAALLRGQDAPGPSVADAAADVVVGQRMIRALAADLGLVLPHDAEASLTAS